MPSTGDPSHEATFCYVDVHWEKPATDGKPAMRTRWRRVRAEQVDEACRVPANNFNCFCSIQRFALRRYDQGETVWMPLFFDFDGEREEALADALKLIGWLVDAGLTASQVRVWFSGNRGFHVTVDPYALGSVPSPDLHRVYKLWAGWLVEFLELSTLDLMIYSVRRVWRLPDSVHHKSGLFKVEISHAEMREGIGRVVELAAQPRGNLWDIDDLDYSTGEPVDTLAEIHAGFVADWQQRIDLRRLRPQHRIAATDAAPACVRWLLERDGLPKAGTVHYAVLALASWHKDAGKNQDDCLAALVPWALRLKIPANRGREREVAAKVRADVRGAYESDDVAFACAYVRSIGTPGDRVACDHRSCGAASADAQQPAEPVELHLSEASRACYHGLPVRMQVVVSGKDTAPFLVPRKLEMDCNVKTVENSRCQSMPCPLAPFRGHHEYEIPPTDPVLMEFVGASSRAVYVRLRELMRIPKDCRDHRLRVTESHNVEDVRLIAALTEHDGGGGRHAVRRGFHVGHGIPSNTPLTIVARTLAEPRSQYAVHQFHEAEPMAGDADAFEVNSQVIRDLSVFQPAEGQTIWDKFEEIHIDLEANVTHIWQRRLMAFAVDMAWHSILRFPFHGSLHPRGWVETFVLGDSGQGKSELVTRLRDWYGVGELVMGEDAGRTGLTYSIQSNERRWFLAWGVVPLNDRRLVIIDEFSGLDPAEFEKMSGLRSSGVLRVHKVISDTTFARTRLIFLSNPGQPGRPSRTLGTYAYGVVALKELIPKPEDIRRIDLVIAVRSGEVPAEIVNRLSLPRVEPIYASDLCRQLVLWAWSRRPDDVVWSAAATRTCLEAAGDMGARYWHDPPIVEPADQRLKIARLACAAAARTFSTDDGSRLLVEPRHVEFAVRLMDACYSGAGLRYDLWSRKERLRNLMGVGQRETVRVGWELLPEWQRLARQLLDGGLFTRGDIEDQLGLDKGDATRIIKFLCHHRLVERRSRGYVMTHGLIEFLHDLVAELGDTVEPPTPQDPPSQRGTVKDLPF